MRGARFPQHASPLHLCSHTAPKLTLTQESGELAIAHLRDDRRKKTEEAIIRAATDLFLQDGYSRTSLGAIADRAGVAARTVYVRFETKARLFQRVIEAATVGDVDSTPLPQREWSVRAMTALTLDERIVAFADGVSDMHERLGPLMAVNGEVEASELSVHESAQRARAATLAFLQVFWESAANDGLLPDDADVVWLTQTGAVLSAAESRLLITRTLGWNREEFREWLILTWERLVRASRTRAVDG